MNNIGKDRSSKTFRRVLFAAVSLCAASYGFEAMAGAVEQCLTGTETPDDGWFEYEMQNNCSYRIVFYVNYCAQSDYSIENSAPDCDERKMVMDANTTMDFRNYAYPLNPRNFK